MFSKVALRICILPAIGLAAPASAAVVIGTGAFGLSSNVKVLNTVGVTVGPVAAVSGTTPPGYDIDGSLASLATSTDLGVVTLVSAGLDISTGLITTNATANGTTLFDTTSGSGFAQINDLDVGLFTRLFGITTTTLGLSADTITSRTTVTRIGNINTLVGESVLSNLNLSVLGLLDFSLGANAQVAPNFVALDALGLRIILNEQTSFTNGSTFESLVTNALRINFNNFILGGRTLTGDLIVGQSRASIDVSAAAVPEPAVWLQLLAGFGLTGMIVRSRRGQLQRVVA